jgi:two-component system response regulator YesN
MQCLIEQQERRPLLAEPARVLLVDDDPDLLAGLSDALAFWLAPVVFDTYLNPHEALQALHASPYRYQVIATDLCMPKINGLALIRQARRLCPHIPIVLMTAYDLAPYSGEAQGLGAYDTICKPFDREEMIAVFRRALAQTRRDH